MKWQGLFTFRALPSTTIDSARAMIAVGGQVSLIDFHIGGFDDTRNTLLLLA